MINRYNIKQAAAYLGISYETFYRHDYVNQIDHTILGGKVYFEERDLLKFLEKQKVYSCSQKSSYTPQKAKARIGNTASPKTESEFAKALGNVIKNELTRSHNNTTTTLSTTA